MVLMWLAAYMPRCLDASMSRCLDASMSRCLNVVSMSRCLDVSMPRCLDASMSRCLDVVDVFPGKEVALVWLLGLSVGNWAITFPLAPPGVCRVYQPVGVCSPHWRTQLPASSLEFIQCVSDCLVVIPKFGQSVGKYLPSIRTSDLSMSVSPRPSPRARRGSRRFRRTDRGVGSGRPGLPRYP